jgi:drug/metabolite transporter (DMT)-like permease
MTDRKVWLAFFLLAIAWGTSFLFIKIAVQTLPPLTVVAGRLLIGSAGLLLIMRWQGMNLPRNRSTWLDLVVVGVINVGVPFMLIVWAESGEQGLDSGVASVLNSTVPLFSIIIAAVLLRMETVTGGKVLGLLIGFAGVVLLLSRDTVEQAGSFLPYAAMVAAAICYAAGTVYARRRLHGIKPVILATGQLIVAAVLVTVLALFLDDFTLQAFTPMTILSLLWLGLLGSCIAYILYFFILQEWGATRTLLVTYLVPVVGVTAGVLFLDERVDWRLFVGALMILSGVGLVNLRRPRRKIVAEHASS